MGTRGRNVSIQREASFVNNPSRSALKRTLAFCGAMKAAALAIRVANTAIFIFNQPIVSTKKTKERLGILSCSEPCIVIECVALNKNPSTPVKQLQADDRVASYQVSAFPIHHSKETTMAMINTLQQSTGHTFSKSDNGERIRSLLVAVVIQQRQ